MTDSADTAAHNDEAAGMPALVRWLGLGLAGFLVAGAAYLIWARGEALVVDLATLAGKVWCF
jgi:hypothetical protein